LAPEVNKKYFVERKHQYIGSVYMHAIKLMYILNERVYSLDHATLWLMDNTIRIVTQSSMMQEEFAFGRNFCCFSDNKWVDTTCHKGGTE